MGQTISTPKGDGARSGTADGDGSDASPGPLIWKKGNRSDIVPFPGGPSTQSFDKLLTSLDFKDFLYNNLDSEYLVTSIIQDAHNVPVLLQGIQFYRSSSKATRELIESRCSRFCSLSSVGTHISPSRTLHTFENELEVRVEAHG